MAFHRRKPSLKALESTTLKTCPPGAEHTLRTAIRIIRHQPLARSIACRVGLATCTHHRIRPICHIGPKARTHRPCAIPRLWRHPCPKRHRSRRHESTRSAGLFSRARATVLVSASNRCDPAHASVPKGVRVRPGGSPCARTNSNNVREDRRSAGPCTCHMACSRRADVPVVVGPYA